MPLFDEEQESPKSNVLTKFNWRRYRVTVYDTIKVVNNVRYPALHIQSVWTGGVNDVFVIDNVED